MSTITIEEMQRDPRGYLHRVEAGETLLIIAAGKPVAEIKPVLPAATSQLRPYGLCAGEFTVPDTFDAPLSDEILDQFECR